MSKLNVSVAGRSFDDAWWPQQLKEHIPPDYTAEHYESVVDCDIEDDLELSQQIADLLRCKIVASSAISIDGGGLDSVRFIVKNGLLVGNISIFHGTVSVKIWAQWATVASDAVESISEFLPRKTASIEEDKVPFAFWRFSGQRGPMNTMRDLTCPSWDEIRGNYPTSVRNEVESLINSPRPDDSGKIILWHGPAGTGKTHMIRALAREWTKRLNVTVEFVMDYQRMFADADYMYSVLLEDKVGLKIAQRASRRLGGGYGLSANDGGRDSNEQPLRLIIIEDGADLFSTKCRDKAGFSRFLNTSDGIVGQGLRTMFLLTANEQIDHIDPAVHRAGRCKQELYFPLFSQEEGNQWLKKAGADEIITEPTNLANLYAKLTGKQAREVTQGIGFGF